MQETLLARRLQASWPTARGRSIGIYEDKEKDEEAEKHKAQEEQKKGVKRVDVFGMKVGLMPAAQRCQHFPLLSPYQDHHP